MVLELNSRAGGAPQTLGLLGEFCGGVTSRIASYRRSIAEVGSFEVVLKAARKGFTIGLPDIPVGKLCSWEETTACRALRWPSE